MHIDLDGTVVIAENLGKHLCNHRESNSASDPAGESTDDSVVGR